MRSFTETYLSHLKGLTPGERSAFFRLVAGRSWDPEKARSGILEIRRRVGREGLEGAFDLVERIEGLGIAC